MYVCMYVCIGVARHLAPFLPGPSGGFVWWGGAGDRREGQPNRVCRPVRIGRHLAHILDVHQDARYVCGGDTCFSSSKIMKCIYCMYVCRGGWVEGSHLCGDLERPLYDQASLSGLHRALHWTQRTMRP